jgi:hypothetical protein
MITKRNFCGKEGQIEIPSNIKKLKIWNMVMGFIHLTAAGALLGIILSQPNSIVTPLYEVVSSVSVKNSSSSQQLNVNFVTKQNQSWNLPYLIVAFFAITSIAHFFYASDIDGFYSCSIASESSNGFRWIEYAITSTLMILVVAILSGIRDVATLAIMAAANVVIMLSGRQIELALKQNLRSQGYNPNANKWMFSFVSAWLLFSVIWFLILFSFGKRISEATNAGASIPYWIWLVQIPTFLFFASFGIINLVQICSKKKYEFFELTYIIFSLISKLFLGIWVAVGIFQSQSNVISV